MFGTCNGRNAIYYCQGENKNKKMIEGFTPGAILKTMFLYTEENASFFAKHRIYCDESLVYKWIRDAVPVPKQHIPAIVDFAAEQIVGTKKKEFRDRIEVLLRQSSLSDQVKEAISLTEDFSEFLRQSIEHAITLRRSEQLQKKKRDDTEGMPGDRTKTWIRLIACALAAPLVGGVLWALTNRVMDLQYYMGGSGNEPTGSLSILWGVIAAAPIISFALLAQSLAPGKMQDFLTLQKRFALVVFYSLLEGCGAFVFYNSGFRVAIESLNHTYGIQEFIIAFVYALILSSIPILALLTLRPHIQISWRFIFKGVIICALAASVTAFGTWVVGRPEAELSQLRGFAVAIILRLCMFVMVYLILSNSKNSTFVPTKSVSR